MILFMNKFCDSYLEKLHSLIEKIIYQPYSYEYDSFSCPKSREVCLCKCHKTYICNKITNLLHFYVEW